LAFARTGRVTPGREPRGARPIKSQHKLENTAMTNMNEINPVQVGTDVPDFEMETYDPASGQFGKLSLAELKARNKWTILVFYPADFTFVCPTELADLAEKYEALKALGAEVASVSTDTKFAHLAWQHSEKLLARVRYPMAADPTGTVSRLFGVYDAATGLALRGTFIINPAGKLVSAEVNFYNVGRNAEELLRKMQANAYLMKHPDEACPAHWHEGEKTLKPSEKLVGKVYEALQA
jgi:peroxiredoxin